jgi:hypothetical protein
MLVRGKTCTGDAATGGRRGGRPLVSVRVAWVSTALLACVTPGPSVEGQAGPTAPAVEPGYLVRLAVGADTVRGRWLAPEGALLRVETDGAVRTLSIEDVDRLWVRRTEARRGAILGATAGAAIVGLVVGVLAEGLCETDCEGADDLIEGFAVGAAVGAVGGVIAGGVLGSWVLTWHPAWP